MHKNTYIELGESLLSGIAFYWLLIESHNCLEVKSIWNISFIQLLFIGIIIGIIWFFANGFLVSGYLKRKICINSNAFQLKVNIYFGDLFKQKGFKAIAVNEYFDSIVDDQHVSSKSLHGLMLQKYWSGNIQDWDKQVDKELETNHSINVISRSTGGKPKNYELGTEICLKVVDGGEGGVL